jgi:hypothetical protein
MGSEVGDFYISLSEAKERAFRNMKSTYRKALMNSFGSKVVGFLFRSILKVV